MVDFADGKRMDGPLLCIYTDRTRACQVRRLELERSGVPFVERSAEELLSGEEWDDMDVKAMARLTLNGNRLPVEIRICD